MAVPVSVIEVNFGLLKFGISSLTFIGLLFLIFFLTLSTLLVNVFYVLNYQENFCTCRTFPHALYWTKRKNSSKNSKMCVDKEKDVAKT